MARNGTRPKPNTGEPHPKNGFKPGQMLYAFCKDEHICPQCHARWVEANVILCALCEAWSNAYKAKTERRKSKRKDKNPSMLEIVIARDLSGQGVNVVLQSDLGKLMSIHKLDSVDVRDARAGNTNISSYRKPPKSVPA